MEFAPSERKSLWLLLIVIAVLVLLTGIGLRDPWPADEPRFAAIARDMLVNGNWLVPAMGGDIYADKPPLFFWILAASFWLTGSIRSGFLIPIACAGLVTLAATVDLARRLFSRDAALWTGIVLLTTFQFALEFKSARIDPVVTMFTTLGLYGLLRHLLLGPSWGWYAFGGLACGLGIITKGVGFLPLLVLLPYAVLTHRGWPGGRAHGLDLRWLLAPAAMLIGIAAWLGPLLLSYAVNPSPALRTYLEEILLGQTVGRYVAASGHLQPWWYFVIVVIPWAWLPITLALPWLYRHWREAVRQRDLKVGVLLSWIGLVVLFFSLSSGKRGVYILPAVPALALVTGPYVSALLEKRTLQRIAWVLLCIVTLAFAGGAAYLAEVGLPHGYTGSAALLLLPFAVWGGLCALAARPRYGVAGLVAFFVGLWAIYGIYIWPRADTFRSGRIIMDHAYAAAPANADIGIAAPKESLVLHARGMLTNFGNRRTDVDQEHFDAARWLSSRPNRWLIIRAEFREPCFDIDNTIPLGHAHGADWLLVPSENARPACVANGRSGNAIAYHAPLAERLR